MSNQRICFVCGLTEEETQIDNHHIVPNNIKTKIQKHNNILPVCKKCHAGIHNSGSRLMPGTKHWKILKHKAMQVKSYRDFNKLIRFSIQLTIIDKLNDIRMYHEFLDYKEFHYGRR